MNASTSRVAVVTGAGRGIGREIARRLAGRGYHVVVADLDESAAGTLASELGAAATATVLDVRDPEGHRRVAGEAAKHGKLCVWVNNAGVLRTRRAWAHPDEELRMIVETNLLGTMWGTRAAIDAMPDGGDIINIDSLSALGPVPGLAVYAATKHGVLGFTTSTQGDLEACGVPVRLHAICPDSVRTAMVDERAGEPEAAAIFSAPKLLDPADVAEAAVATIGSRRVVVSLPRSRALILRSLAPFPRLALRILPLFSRAGGRKQADYVASRRA